MAKRENGGEEVEVPGGPGIPPTTTRRDVANPTNFGDASKSQPFVDPGITDPGALRYAQQAAGRRRPAAIPRYTDAVAGGPDIAIPPLNSEAVGGLTMEQQAERTRLPMPAGFTPNEPALRRPQPSMPTPAGIVTGAEHLAAPAPPARSAGLQVPSGLTPGDILPPSATADPAFRQGQGSQIAMNQPEMALKYGVIRNGQFVPPQQLQQSRMAPSARQVGGTAKPQPAQLSAGTLEQLQAVDRFNAERQAAESSGDAALDRRISADAAAGPAGGAGATKPALTEEEKRNILEEMDEFDITKMRNAIYKDLLNNDDQKKIIEARLKPLDLGQLIVTGRVSQVVPIVPGTFEPEFQSYGADEDLIIKRMLAMELENLKPFSANYDRYITDKYSLMGLTVALKGVNKNQFSDVYNAEGLWDDDRFWAKYKVISKFNFHMIGSLIVNWFWFDLRVRHLFKAEALGNG